MSSLVFIPDVSVIVPVFNAQRFLVQCVQSIAMQSYTNIEIILVNDGSTDDSGSICDMFAQKDSRIKVIHQLNKGVGQARNAGIELARGEYLYFADADDFLELTCIEVAMNNLQASFYDIVVFGFTKISLTGRNLKQIITPAYEIKNLGRDKALLAAVLDTGSGLSVWDKLIKKELIVKNQIRFDSKKRSEDITFIVKCFELASSIKSIDKSLYYYRQVYDAEKKFDIKLLDNLIENYGLIVTLFSSSAPGRTDIIHKYLTKLFVLFFFIVIPINVSSSKSLNFKKKISFCKELLNNVMLLNWRKQLKFNQIKFSNRLLFYIYDIKSPVILLLLGIFLLEVRHLKASLKLK